MRPIFALPGLALLLMLNAVPAMEIAAFRDEMAAAGVPYPFVDFAGATHGFTNPGADAIAERFGMPVGYNERADRDSWNWPIADLNDRL